MDKCTECQNTKIEDIPCDTCKAGVMHGIWKSPCVVYTCDTCGDGFLGAGLWHPCEVEMTEYQVGIPPQELSAGQLVFLARALAIPVLQLKAGLEQGRSPERGFCLRDVMELSRRMEQNGITFTISPEIEYSRYWNCQKEHRC